VPRFEVHCAISKKRTGFGFDGLHAWIDREAEELGVDHRKKRHYFNRTDQRTIKDHWDTQMGRGWGEKAVVEWLFHIALDNLETAYKLSRTEESYGENAFNCIEIVFNRNGYVGCRFDRVRGTLPVPR